VSEEATPQEEEATTPNAAPIDLRLAVFSADDIETDELFVDLWNVTFEIRSMTGGDRATLMASFQKTDGTVDYHKMYPSLVIAGAYNPATGEPVFSAKDIDALNKKSGKALEQVARRVQDMSGMTQKTEDEAGKSSSTQTEAEAS
jgi:hypothetical protein